MGMIWTDRDIEKLKELIDAGYKYSYIAKKLNRTKSSVQIKAMRLQIHKVNSIEKYKINKIISLKDKKTIEEIAKELNISKNTVHKYIRIHNSENCIADKKRRWTEDEINRLRELAKTKSARYIAKEFNRTENSVYLKAQRMGIEFISYNKKWSSKDIEYLKDKWGIVNMATLKLKLKRSKNAIRNKAYELGLDGYITNKLDLTGNYISLKEFSEYSGIPDYRVITTLVPKYSFPLRVIKLTNKVVRYFVNLDDALIWLEQHKDLYDATKISNYLFANEPDWLRKKRISDLSNTNRTIHKKKWDTKDIEMLKLLYYNGKSIEDIAVRLNRTPIAVRCKLYKVYKEAK